MEIGDWLLNICYSGIDILADEAFRHLLGNILLEFHALSKEKNVLNQIHKYMISIGFIDMFLSVILNDFTDI